jgi:hypothetical protein
VKYGNTNGKHQEAEGVLMVKEFLAETEMTEEEISRVAFLVGHHHTFQGVDGIDYQILLEADYIANSTENGYSLKNAENTLQKIFKTKSGIQLLKAIYCI